MKYLFTRNTKEIEAINREVSEGKLYADPSYQRRSVWNEQDNVRLIETILLELVMPEVFFWKVGRDSATGRPITHIVDGQQRINAITEFIDGAFALNQKYLMDDGIKATCGNKFFSDLETDLKNKIWSYPISIVEIDPDCTITDIKQMFYRLNLTNYNLNQQERRNSKDSAFGDKSEALSGYDFWQNIKLFSASDAKRMKDVEYCCSIYILANEGIVDQTNGKKINDYYDDYKEHFDEGKELENKIISAFEIIGNLVDKVTLPFLSKKAQMYTMFCIVFKMIDKQIETYDILFEKFKLFVEAYSKFRNEFVVDYDDAEMMNLFENIKKYKLASSEGINKIANRTIRFEIMYNVCVDSDDSILDELKNIIKDMDARLLERQDKKDNLEKDDVIDFGDEG